MKNLGELVSGDYLAFGALIWRGELTGLTLLLLRSFENDENPKTAQIQGPMTRSRTK